MVELTRRELWAEARRLVVQEQATYEQAAEATGLSLSTLQKRAARERWQDQQDASFGYGQTVRRLKAIALKKALDALERAETADEVAKASQMLFAWQKTEQAFPEHRYAKADADPQVKLVVLVEVIEGLVEFLEDRDRSALALLQPHIVAFAEAMEQRYAA